MRQNRKLLTIMVYIMVVITVIAWWGGCSALIDGTLPLGMSDSHNASYVETGVILIILGCVLTVTDVGLIAYVRNGKLRNLTNIGALISWFCGMASFAWGTVNGRSEWLVYLLMTLPSLIVWIASGPSLKKKDGESW